jgi:hypothetical protein
MCPQQAFQRLAASRATRRHNHPPHTLCMVAHNYVPTMTPSIIFLHFFSLAATHSRPQATVDLPTPLTQSDQPPPRAIPNPNPVYQDVSFWRAAVSGASGSSRYCYLHSMLPQITSTIVGAWRRTHGPKWRATLCTMLVIVPATT